MEKLEKLSGTVSDILFQNEENGYVVCEVALPDRDVVMVGTMPCLMVGEGITAEGVYVNHASYGKQFKVTSCERTLPSNENAMRMFLASGAIKGIGEVLAGRIVDEFGEATFDIIADSPMALASVQGITKKKAEEISRVFNYRMGIKRVMEEFSKLGLTPEQAVAAYSVYGNDAPMLVRQNPYILCRPGIDVSFDAADRIARDIDFDLGDRRRVRAAVIHILTHNLQNGHTYIPKLKLTSVAENLLESFEEEEILEILEEMFSDGEVVITESERHDCVFLPRLYEAESYVAACVARMANDETDYDEDIDAIIDETESEMGIEYAVMQREAVKHAAARRFMVLTGGPGTGKTTTVNAMIDMFEALGKKVALCAPTGRAAQRMTQLSGREAKTIHRLLEVKPMDGGITPEFARNERRPLSADVIIADECSMIDILLMEALMRALKRKAHLILVGDFNQLPSVGAGNVLLDIIESECADVVELDEIFRQAAQSNIIVSSHGILNGEYPILDRKEGDFFFLYVNDEELGAKKAADLIARRLPKAYGYDPFTDIQIITPTKLGALGTKELNIRLQERLNPSYSMPHLKRRDTVLKLGDKVMQTKNNYDIPWIKKADGISSTGVFNGDIGRVAQIDAAHEIVVVDYYDKLASYPFSSVGELELAYAITVHKSQGSEFDAVILPLYHCPVRLRNREILYTAFTRAKELLVVVGDYETLTQMVDNLRHSKRYTLLREMIQTLVMENEDGGMTLF
ncbi:MAG: ATP-dependent RecD-like DNA helicase [Clostridia bacterium]|nr:ATP-dependent RecD-like DNA helicase [Clostridia bacterium]